jgi:hypothetical protein
MGYHGCRDLPQFVYLNCLYVLFCVLEQRLGVAWAAERFNTFVTFETRDDALGEGTRGAEEGAETIPWRSGVAPVRQRHRVAAPPLASRPIAPARGQQAVCFLAVYRGLGSRAPGGFATLEGGRAALRLGRGGFGLGYACGPSRERLRFWFLCFRLLWPEQPRMIVAFWRVIRGRLLSLRG